jgi:hypothetical protein
MIDFKEELAKYKPVLDMDDVERVVNDEIVDMMDLLQYVADQVSKEAPKG